MSEAEEDFVEASQEFVSNKILHTLKIYPKLSASMLQVGIGTALPPKIWRPILDKLEKSGRIKQYDVGAVSPSGRDQTYHIIELVPLAPEESKE